MKFPLMEHPFRPLDLTQEQCEYYEQFSNMMVDELIEEYEHFVHVKNRTLSKSAWKAVKTREALTVYKQLERSVWRNGPFKTQKPMRLPTNTLLSTTSGVAPTPSSYASSRSSSSSSMTQIEATIPTNVHEWRLPKLLAVGSIAGVLEDVMYGVIAPDVKAMLLRSAYVNDELVDGGVLHQMKGATDEDPFQFLGLKWYVKAHSAALNTMVAPRDTVVIDGTGMRTLPNGDRIGYHIIHSVELPECPELRHLSIVRGRLSSGYLFRQALNGAVEVYMKSYVEPAGSLPDTVAIMSVANALIGCWKSVFCAQSKKLAWLVRDARRQRGARKFSQEADKVASHSGWKHECGLCQTTFRALKGADCCKVCRTVVCSRCHMDRKICSIGRGLQMKQMSVVVCKTCIAHVVQLSSHEIAAKEWVEKTKKIMAKKQTAHYAAQLMDEDDSESWLDTNRSGSVEKSSSYSVGNSAAFSIETTSTFTDSSYSSSSNLGSLEQLHSMSQIDTIESIDESEPESPYKTGTTLYHQVQSAPKPKRTWQHAPAPEDLQAHRQQLWMQMNQLRIAAEQTYMITQQNSNSMHQYPQSNPRVMMLE